MTAIPSGTKFIGISSSVPTPENKSAQSNGYQEVYTIDDIITEAQAGLPTAPTTTLVNITPTQTIYDDGRPTLESGILAMGTTPIELLPAPGANKYYDFEKIVLEVDGNLVDYTYSTLTSIILRGALIAEISPTAILERSYSQVVIIISNNALYNTGVYNYTEDLALDSALTLSTDNSENPSAGNGTLRAIITYTIKTFGA